MSTDDADPPVSVGSFFINNSFSLSLNDIINYPYMDNNIRICLNNRFDNLNSLKGLEDKFYEAAINPILWPVLLQFMKDYYRANFAAFVLCDKTSNTADIDCKIGKISQEILDNLNDIELLKNQNNLIYFNSILLFGRNENDTDFSTEKRQFFADLKSHYNRSIKLIAKIRNNSDFKKSIIEALEHLNKSIAVLNIKGNILYLSDSSKKLFDNLTIEDIENAYDFTSIIENSTANSILEKEFFIANKFVKIKFSLIKNFNDINTINQIIIGEFLVNKKQENSQFSDATEKFGLTKSEVKIVELLLKGLSVLEIAKARNTSYETVRAQLRSLRVKTGAKSQIELIAIIKDSQTFE